MSFEISTKNRSWEGLEHINSLLFNSINPNSFLFSNNLNKLNSKHI